MKKYICIAFSFLLLLSVFSFSACGTDEKTGKLNKNSETGAGVVFEKTTVSSGETVKCSVYINCELFACADIIINIPEHLKLNSSKSVSAGKIISEGLEDENSFVISAYVATTQNCSKTDVYELEFTVDDSVSSGDVIKISGSLRSFLKGTDENGANTVDILNESSFSGAELNVA